MSSARAPTATSEAADGAAGAPFWRRWLLTFVATVLGLGGLLYLAVLLIDPYSTGRFSPLREIDIASRNVRLFKAGVARDPHFNAAIIGSSTGVPLDPSGIGAGSGWSVAQLAIPAALPPSQLVVARSFQRHHASEATLQIYVLDHLWCRPGDPTANAWGAFPDWIYESTPFEYLSRILFPDSVSSAARRLAIRAGVARPPSRPDGFVPTNLPFVPRAMLAGLVRPTADDAPGSFPALDLLTAHVATLPANVGLVFAFAPPYVTLLPAAGSAAGARLVACKTRVRAIAAARPKAAFVDLMAENAVTGNEAYFYDELHYTAAAAGIFASTIVEAMKQRDLMRR